MGTERTVSEILGMNLAALRGVAGLSQEQLAAAMATLGFSWHRQTVTEIEAGRRPVSVEEVATLAAFFDMPPQALIVSPSSFLSWSAGASGVRVGDRVINAGEWVNLWPVRETLPDREPPQPRHRAAVDRLMKGLRRPWAQRWRERGGPAMESFAEVREERLSKRTRHPGPIYVSQVEGLTFGVARPPWSEAHSIHMEPGQPYSARDEAEAKKLEVLERQKLVRKISRQTAYRLRQRNRTRGKEE